MLFDSSIRKELARSFGATLVVLVTVVMTMMLIRTLGQAARGNVKTTNMMQDMGFTVLGQLPTILSLSLFIAIVGTLSRMYRESEMVIWFASGRGLSSLLRPLLRFSWPVMLAVGVLSLGVWPWANRQIQELRFQYEQRSDIDRIAPGEFQESANGRRVFFIDKESPDPQSANNVFILPSDAKDDTVNSESRVRMEVRGDERVLVLSQGQRLDTPADKSGTRISQFEEYSTHIGQAPPSALDETQAKSRATLRLIEDPQPLYMAELGWRLGLALAAFNRVLLALGLASVNPRASRSGNLMLALFTFIVYYNFMTLGQSWVAAGKLGLPTYMALLHGGTFELAALVLAVRHNHWSPAQLWQRGAKA